jgi:flagellar M-ring protein FliF
LNGVTSRPRPAAGRTACVRVLRQLGSGVAQTWSRLSISARANLVLAGVFSLVLIGVLVFFGAQPQYGRLFDRLSLDEANEIAVYLNDNNIPFRLRDGGTAVDVPVREISRARVGLAALNLPQSQGRVPGFELFDTRDLMSNRFLDDVDYMRALQGTLQRQLNQFDFVRGSSVFIREAPDQLFSSEQRPSEATVTIDTGGKRPSDMQIKAIVNTISSFGGANLSPRNINVAMSDGTILHSPSTDEFASLAGDKLAYQMAYEETRQKKIMEQFRAAGRRAVVNVNASFDWTSEEKRQRDVREGAEISTLSTETTVRGPRTRGGRGPGRAREHPRGRARRSADRTHRHPDGNNRGRGELRSFGDRDHDEDATGAAAEDYSGGLHRGQLRFARRRRRGRG